MSQSKKKFSKGAFRMQDLKNVEIQGEFSPFLRFCIGISLVLLTASPFVWALLSGIAKIKAGMP